MVKLGTLKTYELFYHEGNLLRAMGSEFGYTKYIPFGVDTQGYDMNNIFTELGNSTMVEPAKF